MRFGFSPGYYKSSYPFSFLTLFSGGFRVRIYRALSKAKQFIVLLKNYHINALQSSSKGLIFLSTSLLRPPFLGTGQVYPHPIPTRTREKERGKPAIIQGQEDNYWISESEREEREERKAWSRFLSVVGPAVRPSFFSFPLFSCS